MKIKTCFRIIQNEEDTQLPPKKNHGGVKKKVQAPEGGEPRKTVNLIQMAQPRAIRPLFEQRCQSHPGSAMANMRIIAVQ